MSKKRYEAIMRLLKIIAFASAVAYVVIALWRHPL